MKKCMDKERRFLDISQGSQRAKRSVVYNQLGCTIFGKADLQKIEPCISFLTWPQALRNYPDNHDGT